MLQENGWNYLIWVYKMVILYLPPFFFFQCRGHYPSSGSASLIVGHCNNQKVSGLSPFHLSCSHQTLLHLKQILLPFSFKNLADFLLPGDEFKFLVGRSGLFTVLLQFVSCLMTLLPSCLLWPLTCPLHILLSWCVLPFLLIQNTLNSSLF